MRHRFSYFFKNNNNIYSDPTAEIEANLIVEEIQKTRSFPLSKISPQGELEFKKNLGKHLLDASVEIQNKLVEFENEEEKNEMETEMDTIMKSLEQHQLNEEDPVSLISFTPLFSNNNFLEKIDQVWRNNPEEEDEFPDDYDWIAEQVDIGIIPPLELIRFIEKSFNEKERKIRKQELEIIQYPLQLENQNSNLLEDSNNMRLESSSNETNNKPKKRKFNQKNV
jgi:hypothetical protein